MREVFATAAAWLEAGRPFALATLAELRAAKTAPIGTSIAVDCRRHASPGNIGAGCYESEIIETAQQTLRDGVICVRSISTWTTTMNLPAEPPAARRCAW